ncbi:M56 family metallopeptidase [Sinanaerobacter chloroacetimidivorans]|uniref:DUF4825 domain-containing protein n=1 Tax=Sinanaerobacter chloroacetimidivorans TaxID=2818044 RepID=A0A8J8B2J0_9FIRM|nr:M56 family metallopeptidase [Sinanaerobacter chloroacetimidivorans]MBR0598777.1 DUF4825 domain-containing protein [Sinanaerobacter chloroacetimidivorans]
MELLINMTIAGTVTASVILMIKIIFKNKLTPKWHVAIWLVLALRLLIPGLPESNVSIFNTVPRADHVQIVENTIENSTDSTVNEQAMAGRFTVKAPITGVERKGEFTVRKQLSDWILYGWAAGMTVMAAYLMGVSVVFGRRARKLPLCSDRELFNLFEECKREAGIQSDRITLRMGSNTPMLQGILRPVILIPEGYTYQELRHILLHELCHYKHKDIWINILCCIILCIYWFNPVLWICFFVIRRDLEMLCDYRAIEITGERKAYATVLLRTALRKNQFIFATTSMQNGEKEVSKRIRSIALSKKPKRWITISAFLLLLVIAAICLTNGSFSNTVIQDAGEGYYFKIPESWEKNAKNEVHDGPESFLGYTIFYDGQGNTFGGIETLGIDIRDMEQVDYETIDLPTPNHSVILERKVMEGILPFPVIMVNLDQDLETAAQEAERNTLGDKTPLKKSNQNHIFLWPDQNFGRVFDLWADSSEVDAEELLEIAKTFQKEPDPQMYQPETYFTGDWSKTADYLLTKYFDNYRDAELTKASDISGYEITNIQPVEDKEGSWSVVYPDAAVFLIDYTLTITYPDQYTFAGGDFEIGEGNKTKIYYNQLAVFQTGSDGQARFLGFVWPQNIGEMGESMAIIHTINYSQMDVNAKLLLEHKTPYIGNHVMVGQLIQLMPLARYASALELQTKEEPYGLTVNYDMTQLGGQIFADDGERAPTDSRGWDPNPYLNAQLYQNAAKLLALIDNAGWVSLKVQGISDIGAPYTYIYNLDRTVLNEKFPKDARLSTESYEKFVEFLSLLAQSQSYPAEKDMVYQINE